MVIFDVIITGNIKKYNGSCPKIPHHPYRILVIDGSGTGKTNILLNLIHNQPDSDKIYIYTKDTFDNKFQLIPENHYQTGIKNCKDPEAIH